MRQCCRVAVSFLPLYTDKYTGGKQLNSEQQVDLFATVQVLVNCVTGQHNSDLNYCCIHQNCTASVFNIFRAKFHTRYCGLVRWSHVEKC